MSDAFFLPPMQVASSLFDVKGRPNLPMRKLWDNHRSAITDQFNAQGFILDDLSATQDDLADAQSQLMTVVFDMDDVQADIIFLLAEIVAVQDEQAWIIAYVEDLASDTLSQLNYIQGNGGRTAVSVSGGYGQVAHGVLGGSWFPNINSCFVCMSDGQALAVSVTSVDFSNLYFRVFELAGGAPFNGICIVKWHVGPADSF